jgi:SNF2 family DNA or RNA helicase
MTLTPRPYQIVGRDFLAARQFGLLADEMRVGKTPQAILACSKLAAERILVVCPAIAVEHWRREFPRWHGAYGVQGLRPPYVEILSYDRAKINAAQILAEQWDVAIVDECHFAGNPEAKRTQLVYGRDGIGSVSKRLWALSGTPAPKHAGSLWPMLTHFGLIEMDYSVFLRRYCRIDYLSQRPVGTKEDMIPELRALLAKCMLRRTRKDVAPDMPEIGFDFLEMTPTSKADLPADADLERAPPDNRQDVALAKVGPLGDEIEFAITNGLLKQTVVFGWHVEPLKVLARQLIARGLRVGLITGETPSALRTAVQHDFINGMLDVVLAQILAAGTAIDLSAASHGYFLELDWLGTNNLQAANRLVSMQKAEAVTFDVCTWPGSHDDRVQQVLVRRMREIRKLI